jgi:hypothetical protein
MPCVRRHPQPASPFALMPIVAVVACWGCGHAITSENPASSSPVQANLIANGDFAGGIAPWGAHVARAPSSQPPLEPRLEQGALCTPVRGGEEVIVGWPVAGSGESFALVAGHRYALSMRVSASGPSGASGASPMKCVIKVGHQVAPYTAAFATELPLSQSLQPFSTAFAPDHDDALAGLAVECRAEPGSPAADVCIDDVRLGS